MPGEALTPVASGDEGPGAAADVGGGDVPVDSEESEKSEESENDSDGDDGPPGGDPPEGLGERWVFWKRQARPRFSFAYVALRTYVFRITVSFKELTVLTLFRNSENATRFFVCDFDLGACVFRSWMRLMQLVWLVRPSSFHSGGSAHSKR